MVDLKALQKEIYMNKVKKGFNIDNVYWEFCYLYSEVAEAFNAYNKKEENLGEELADIAIFLLGIAEILNINLEEQIVRKIDINKKRQYAEVNGKLIRIESE